MFETAFLQNHTHHRIQCKICFSSARQAPPRAVLRQPRKALAKNIQEDTAWAMQLVIQLVIAMTSSYEIPLQFSRLVLLAKASVLRWQEDAQKHILKEQRWVRWRWGDWDFAFGCGNNPKFWRLRGSTRPRTRERPSFGTTSAACRSMGPSRQIRRDTCCFWG